jgi:hypothetical protein
MSKEVEEKQSRKDGGRKADAEFEHLLVYSTSSFDTAMH